MTRIAGLFGVLCLVLAACGAQLRSPSELPLAYRQGEDAFRLGHYEQAVRAYRTFLKGGGYDDLVPRALYKMALAEFRRGGYEECLEILDGMQERFPKERWPQVYALRGDAEDARGNTVSALHWWEEAWIFAEETQKPRLATRVQTALAQLSRKALESARTVLVTPEMQALVDERLRQIDAGAAVSRPPRGRKATAARAAARAPRLPPGAKPRIGCLLPLSGPYAAYGRRSLNGIRLALDQRLVDLAIYDEGGQPEVARAAMEQLVADRTVLGVIGPLRSTVADAVAPLAERKGTPLVLLAQRTGLRGRYVLQLALTPEQQAAELAEYAIDRQRLRRFGVVHPSDPYGSALARAFEEEVVKRGGRLAGAIAYAPGATEFGIEALSVQKWREEDGIEAVFVPDSAATATVLAAELRRAVPGLGLLGSDGWHDVPELARDASAVDGVVFTDGFFAYSKRRATQDFVASYQGEYRAVPGILEAQAYDAAMLLRRALEAGARSRSGVLSRLAAMRPIEGAAGHIAVGPDGIRREIFVLQLAGGMIREVGGERDVAVEPVRETVLPTAGTSAGPR